MEVHEIESGGKLISREKPERCSVTIQTPTRGREERAKDRVEQLNKAATCRKLQEQEKQRKKGDFEP